MKHSLSDNIMMRLSTFISDNLALHFPKERWNDLTRNITAASKEYGYTNVEEFIQHIINSPISRENMEVLAANLTISETYFWRETQTFSALEHHIIPELIRRKIGKNRIRVWSAGCCSGEEPYSIAIAFTRMLKEIKNWNISILATDINTGNLNKAALSEYAQWSFRGTPPWLKEQYFTLNSNKKFEIIPSIKEMVKYEYLNLADDIYPSPLNETNAMDLIYCRNVLMYFSQERCRQVVKGLYNSLTEGGFLVVSASELSQLNFQDFVPVNVPGMVLYQKLSSRPKHQKPVYSKDDFKNQVNSDQPPASVEPIETKEDPVKINPQIDYEIFAEVEELVKPDSDYKEAQKFYSQGNYTEVIDKLQKKNQSLKEHILLIRAYANLGNFTEAIKSSAKALEANKLDPGLHFLHATILLENNDPDEAIASLKRSIFLDTNFVVSYFSLAKIYERQGKMANANKCYENILNILNTCKQDDLLPESEGITAGRFREIINASLQTRILK